MTPRFVFVSKPIRIVPVYKLELFFRFLELSFVGSLYSILVRKFVSSANLKELLISDSPEELVEMVSSHKRPSDDDWTNRLGL